MSEGRQPAERRRRPGRVLGAAYRRLGRRYPTVALALEIQLLYVVFIVGVGVLSLYIDMTLAEFARLACATVVIQTFYNAFLLVLMLRLLGPVREWTRGRRDSETAERAWKAAARLPLDFLRSTTRYGFPLWANALWSIYAVAELDLPALSVPLLMAGVAVAQLYGFGLLFLATERAMRPILEDTSAFVSGATRLEGHGVPVRWRLLTALPVLNVITGVVVAGISSPGSSLTDLGVDVAIAVGVAFTVSLGLTALLATSIVSPIVELREATERVSAGELEARVPVASTDETGELAQSFNEMTAGLEERERLHKAFGQFVDPELAERIARDDTDFAGKDVELSILFVDVRGFTALAERHEPREIVARLNNLYDCIVPIVLKHGGHANKFIGDGMLAIFGAPERLEDHAQRAVAAALEAAEAVQTRFGDELGVGIGVNSGSALVGTIGGGGRLDFTAIGDAVNTAARVEAETRNTGDDVLIAEPTRKLLGDAAADWMKRADARLKGKSEVVAVYAPRTQVDGRDEDPADA